MRRYLSALLESLSGLLLLSGRMPGAIALAILAIRPGLVLCGLTAWIGATLCSALIGSATPLVGPAGLNPLLTGLAIGFLVEPSVGAVVLAALAGVAVALVGAAANHASRNLRISAFSAPYCLVAAVVTLALPHYPALTPALSHGVLLPDSDLGLPLPIAGALRAFGALVWLPHPLAGLALAAAVAWRSRIQLLIAIVGVAVAAGLRTLGGRPWIEACSAPDSYNVLLAAMAIGGVMLVPSWKSMTLAIFASAGCALIADAMAMAPWWGGAGLSSFTLPFVIVTATVMAVLVSKNSALIVQRLGATPEETMVEQSTWRARFPGSLRSVAPPCAGVWTVWQGEDGAWTHRGAWRHALDLVIANAQGRTHDGDGMKLEDYFAFGQPVLSPVSGYVVNVIDGMPDRSPGEPDAADRWGNLVVIRDGRGFHVELSHFQRGSLAVVIGQWVERGQYLGRCGNSGFSPQPHIHLQVQECPLVGSRTVPFSMATWWDGARFRANELPSVGESVEALAYDLERAACVRLLLGDELNFQVERDGQVVDRVQWRVSMAADGSSMLVSPRGRLYFGAHESTFYVYRVEGDDPWLRRLFCAAPRLPLARRTELDWTDLVPITAVEPGWRGAMRALCSLVTAKAAYARTRHRWHAGRIDSEVVGGNLVRSRKMSLDLDPIRGLVALRDGRWALLREIQATPTEVTSNSNAA